jgi:capsular polysaccharide biosynthesis protein
MELKDAARRILRQHLPLVVTFVVVGALLGVLHANQPTSYTAATRLVLGTDDPKSRTEAGSIADTGKAIATSLTQVRGAIQDAHLKTRNPIDVARNHVFVRALGTSGVVQLSVSDKNAGVAAAIANALAKRVIAVRTEVTSGELNSIIKDLSTRIDDLNAKIATVDQDIDSLNIRAAQAGSPASANALRQQRDEASRQRDFLAQQRALLESERITVLSNAALRPAADVISAASIPTHPDSSPYLQEFVLGALLGLVLGIGAAGLIETVRPTLVGSDSVARELGTPLLGAIPTGEDEQRGRALLARVALRLRLAADAAGVHNVSLVAVGPDVELGLLAATLDELAADAAGRKVAQGVVAADGHAAGGSAAPANRQFRIRPFGIVDGRSDNGQTALVLVSPSVAQKEEIDEVSHLLRVAGSPVLGLITYERPREQPSRFQLSSLRPR